MENQGNDVEELLKDESNMRMPTFCNQEFWQNFSPNTSQEMQNQIKQADPEVAYHYVKFDLNIIDYGSGMPDDMLKNLFINFGKLKVPKGQNPQGVGLGLSICK
jgi:signal transduction histidine kinase